MEAIDEIVFNPLAEFFASHLFDPQELLGFIGKNPKFRSRKPHIEGLSLEYYVNVRLFQFSELNEYFTPIGCDGFYEKGMQSFSYLKTDLGNSLFYYLDEPGWREYAEIDALYFFECNPVVIETEKSNHFLNYELKRDLMKKMFAAEPFILKIHGRGLTSEMRIVDEYRRGITIDVSGIFEFFNQRYKAF